MFLYYILITVSPFAIAPVLSHFLSDPFKVLGVACGAYAAIYVARKASIPPFLRAWQSRLFIAFYALAAFSFATKGLAASLSASVLLIYTSLLVFLLTTVALVDSARKINHVLTAAVIGIAWGGTYLIREWLVVRDRVGMSVGDGNYFTTSAALLLPYACLRMVESRRKRARVFFGLCLLVSLVGIALCASRGGFVALMIAVVVLALHTRRPVRTIGVIAAVMLPVMLLAPVSPVYRLIHPSHSDDTSQDARLIAWRAGMRMIAKHPLAGVGLGNFKPLMREYIPSRETASADFESMAHNTYIELAAELGIPGLILFMALLYQTYARLEAVRRATASAGPPELHVSALALKAGLVGYAAGAMFLSAQYQKLFWLAVFLSIALDLVRRRTRSRLAPRVEAVRAPVMMSVVDSARECAGCSDTTTLECPECG